MRRVAGYALVAAAVGGCGDPLVERQLIADTRVLSARSEVIGEPTRATPRAGEGALVRLFVVGPDGPPSVHWRLEACVADATTSGAPRCQDTVAVAEGAGVPEVAFTTPALPPDTRLAVVGIVCDGLLGDVTQPWPAHRCAAGVDRRVHYVVATAPESPANENPDTERDAFAFGDREWVPGDCATDAPHVASLSAHVLRWAVGSDNREVVGDAREALLLSHFVTGGDLERAFSGIAGDVAEAPAVEVAWTAPEVAAGEQRSVTFHFVVRDGRGGSDWTSRRVCVEG